MEALNLILSEAIFIGLCILLLYHFKKIIGLEILYVFIGSLQFFQTILASNVYNNIFEEVVLSPGSSVLFNAALFTILLLFHTEKISKARSLIFGLIISNVLITIISFITYEQIKTDNYTIQADFLSNLLNDNTTLFLVGTFLLYLDCFIMLFIYAFLDFILKQRFLFLRILITLVFISIFDSIIFYNLNYFLVNDNANLVLSSIIGKVLFASIFSILLFSYLRITKKMSMKNSVSSSIEIIKIFTFNENKD